MADQTDTIRILVATDNHVGYAEDDQIRGDDGWRTFDEILSLASSRDVDMVLLGGDLFHDNKPSRKSMVHVMESLRKHCLGDKPCSLEMIGDQSEHFSGAFNHANYLDPNVNVSIPVFSIHGNHDDPSGEGHYAALDELQMSGLVNYYGRVPESDRIDVKPILLQKGSTKLALYGLSNVRDERLFRTFRDHHVKFFRPGLVQDEWYNILSVHQNHVAHTDTSWLPETFLPSFMNMVIWGHEHECLIEPRKNYEMGFEVMQPGSSIATSLMPGEAVPKHIAILSITGKECDFEKIRLRSVRPFIYQDIVLQEDKKLKESATKPDNFVQVKEHCKRHVDEMIAQARQEWQRTYRQESRNTNRDAEVPLPLVRLRVECTPPKGGQFKIEQTQRFSKEYTNKVANTSDVIQFHRKRATATRIGAKAEDPEKEAIERLDSTNVAKFIHEHLQAQSLVMLPRNLFGDAITQFVDKGDKRALEHFVNDNCEEQVKGLMVDDEEDEELDNDERQLRMEQGMRSIQDKQEKRFDKGEIRARRGTTKAAPRKPANWDSDENGHWSAQNGTQRRNGDADSDEAEDMDVSDADSTAASSRTTTRGRGRGSRARGGTARGASTTARKAPARKAPAKATAAKKTTAASKEKLPFADDDGDEEDHDVMMIDDEDDDNSGGLFVSQASAEPVRKAPVRQAATRQTGPRTNGTAASTAKGKQTTLSFGAPSQSTARQPAPRLVQSAADPVTHRRGIPIEVDDIDDDDDAFETPVSTRNSRR